MPKLTIIAVSLFFYNLAVGQSPSRQVDFNPEGAFEYSGSFSAFATRIDRMGRPFLYTANKELGLITFETAPSGTIISVDTISVGQLGQLKPTNLVQREHLLFVSLGDFQGRREKAGLAILDVSTPEQPSLISLWSDDRFEKGSAIVEVSGNYAYLGAMEDGLIILDISDPEQIEFLSRTLLDPDFPAPPGLFSVPHARGLAILDDVVFICHDAGGLRAVDISNKATPIEIGKYVNDSLNTVAQPAYNNILIRNGLGYVAVDYCGLDVVDLTDPTDMKTVHWYNPWDCSPTNWSGSPGHTNQLALNEEKNILFVSGGDSELLAFDISEEGIPLEIGRSAAVGDSAVAWGVDIFRDRAALSFIDNHLLWIPGFQPYYSDYGGVRLLSWKEISTGTSGQLNVLSDFDVYPNPANGSFYVSYRLNQPATIRLRLSNLLGQTILWREFSGQQPAREHRRKVEAQIVMEGIYFLTLYLDDHAVTKAVTLFR